MYIAAINALKNDLKMYLAKKIYKFLFKMRTLFSKEIIVNGPLQAFKFFLNKNVVNKPLKFITTKSIMVTIVN